MYSSIILFLFYKRIRFGFLRRKKKEENIEIWYTTSIYVELEPTPLVYK